MKRIKGREYIGCCFVLFDGLGRMEVRRKNSKWFRLANGDLKRLRRVKKERNKVNCTGIVLDCGNKRYTKQRRRE